MTDPQVQERPRHPVLRTGERAPIPAQKRVLIYQRDGYTCQWCGAQAAPWDIARELEQNPFHVRRLQLDHVTPWSALGSDRSDNLRTLCASCNEARSNYIDANPPRLVGVATACYWCAHARNNLPQHLEAVPTSELDRIPAYCGCCGTTSWVPHENWIL